jgi:hypothetical protein
MANYCIYLVDPFNEIKQIVSVAQAVNEMFDPIAKKAGFSGVSTMFPQYRNINPLVHEMIVYICPFTTSVVKKMPNASKLDIPDATSSPHQGVTVISKETGSEIWCKFSGVKFYAAMIFHELMHNKLQLGKSLHSKFKSCGMSCEVINPETAQPTEAEIDAMAAALTSPVIQWTGGVDMLWNAAEDKNNGNDLWSIAISG